MQNGGKQAQSKHLLFDKVYDNVRDKGADRSAKNVQTPAQAFLPAVPQASKPAPFLWNLDLLVFLEELLPPIGIAEVFDQSVHVLVVEMAQKLLTFASRRPGTSEYLSTDFADGCRLFF
jgi:hypothetical protein